MITYALDTNIVSYMLKGDTHVDKIMKEKVLSGNDLALPPVVYYEIQRWLLFVNATAKLKTFNELCEKFILGNTSIDTFKIAANEHSRLKKLGYNLDDADVFIASYCITNAFTLVTNNTKHFELFENLSIENWI